MSQSAASRVMVSDAVGMTSPQYLSVTECSLDSIRTFGREEGHKGTRQRTSCRSRITSDKSGGSISGNFVAAELDWLLPRAIGTTGASPLIPGETINHFWVLVDKVAELFLYNKQRIKSFEVSGSETQYLNWTFNLVGELESVYGSTWPASPLFPACGSSMLFSDCIFTYSGTAYAMQSFKLTVDNMIDENQFENALTPTRFESQDLMVSLEVQLAYRADTKVLHRAALDGAASSLTMNDGTSTYSFLFGNLKIPDGGPKIPRQGRINQSLRMESFRAASITATQADNQLVITKA